MTFLEHIQSVILSLTFRWAILFGGRKAQIEASRAVRENEKEKKDLPVLKTPQKVSELIMKTRYMPDPFNGKWDYIASAEWMYYKLYAHSYQKIKEGPYIGDCDDYAFLFAKLVVLVPGVTNVRINSLTYRGAAHAFCSYDYKGERFYFDYGILSRPEKTQDMYSEVARRYSNDPVWIIGVSEEVTANKPIPGKARILRNV